MWLPIQRQVFAITGGDAQTWLQGQCTQNILIKEEGVACLCKPTGQLLAIFDYKVEPDRILVALEPERAAHLLQRIEESVIMEEVSIEDLGVGRCATESDNVTLRGGSFRGVVLLNSNEDMHTLGDGAWGYYRLSHGIPEEGKDTTEKTLPPELGPAFEALAIDYDKGCYAGQEVLQRIHSRGHTNKTWIGLKTESLARPGDPVLVDGEPAGRVTSSASHEGDNLAGVLVSNQFAENPGPATGPFGVGVLFAHPLVAG